jgi:hypothetical protein
MTVATNQLPSTTYTYGRAGLEGRRAFGPISVALALAYLPVFSADPIGTRFARGAAVGVDGSLGASFAITAALSARADLHVRRFASAFTPAAGDPYAARGATDDLYGATLGVAYAF